MQASSAIRPSLAPYEVFPLQDMLSRTAARLPDKVAVIDGDRRFTFRQLESLSGKLAGALAKLGVAKGEHVGILAPNCAEFEIAFFGILMTGATVTTINSGYREREIAHQINDSGCRKLFVHRDILETAQAARDAAPNLERIIVIEETSENPDSFWGMIESAPEARPDIAVNPLEDLAALPYSSGTTGLSKGVMLTHYNLTTNVRQYCDRRELARISEQDVMLVHLPLFHIYALTLLMGTCISVGATQVMMGRFDMEDFLGLISRNRVSRLYSVPPVGLGLTQYPGVANHDLSSLRLGLFGAAPLSGELQRRVSEALGCPIMQGYGLTETSPLTNADFIEPELARPGSVGPAASDTEERVVDLETGTKDLAADEVGELLVRGPQVMKGYFNNTEATRDALSEDGWLHTGDIVRTDADGYVWVLDRKKELIKYKGFQVPPAELEGLLLEHPGIADAAVIGKADVESGEVPKAFVVRRGDSEVSAADIMEFVASKVATFKQVREVEFIDAIPKNPSGKILRRVLIELERSRGG